MANRKMQKYFRRKPCRNDSMYLHTLHKVLPMCSGGLKTCAMRNNLKVRIIGASIIERFAKVVGAGGYFGDSTSVVDMAFRLMADPP